MLVLILVQLLMLLIHQILDLIFQPLILLDWNTVSGWTGSSQMTKSTAIGSTAFPAGTFTVGIDTTPSSGYGLTISLGSTDTRSVKAGRYVYDILVGSGATVYRIVDGNIQVRGGVSSAP